jgi:hypothetical protein
LKKELVVRLIEFEAWGQAISIHMFLKSMAKDEIHFQFPKMIVLSHISESIWWMGFGDNVTTNLSEWLYVSNVKQAY